MLVQVRLHHVTRIDIIITCEVLHYQCPVGWQKQCLNVKHSCWWQHVCICGDVAIIVRGSYLPTTVSLWASCASVSRAVKCNSWLHNALWSVIFSKQTQLAPHRCLTVLQHYYLVTASLLAHTQLGRSLLTPLLHSCLSATSLQIHSPWCHPGAYTKLLMSNASPCLGHLGNTLL